MTRFGLFIIWLLHFLPLAVLARIGIALGWLAYIFVIPRRRIVNINLKLCFPELDAKSRRLLARRHFYAVTRALLEHGILWWGSEARVKKLVRIEGQEHMDAVKGKPIIWLAPHFVGLDMGGVRLATEYEASSMYSRQKNKVFDDILLHGRSRFLPQQLFSRQDGIRPLLRALKNGLPFYYLPDMDFGWRESIFVPFFGVPAATITGVSRLAQAAHAVVVPVITRQLPGGAGYVLRFYPAWDNFPTDDVVADTRRVNAFIEDIVREMPAQYYWVHKRFKTRPPGEPSLYKKQT